MAKREMDFERGGLIIGGGTLIGLGVGFTRLSRSPLLFVASILIGVGAGLVIAAILGNR